MSTTERQAIVRTAAVYASAFWITTLAHELAHAVAGLAVGRHPILHTLFVHYADEGSTTAQITTALAGPLFSALSGLVLTLWSRSGRVPARLDALVTWLGYHGLVCFVGYVFSTAFASTADLGRVARLAGANDLVCIAITVLGFGLLRLVARPLGASLARQTRAFAGDAKRATSRGVIAPAWLATAFLLVAISPPPHPLTYVYALTAPLPLFELLGRTEREEEAAPRDATTGHGGALVVTLVVVVVLSRLLLDGGIALG